MRHRLLAAAAFVTALATGYVATLDERADVAGDGGLAAVATATRASAAAEGARAPQAAGRARGDWPAPADDALRAWGPVPSHGPSGESAVARAAAPAAVRAGATAAAAPTAASAAAEPLPPPPWRWIGLVDEDGSARALLATPQQVRVVAAGEQLDALWRVERIGAEAVELRALGREQSAQLAWETR